MGDKPLSELMLSRLTDGTWGGGGGGGWVNIDTVLKRSLEPEQCSN